MNQNKGEKEIIFHVSDIIKIFGENQSISPVLRGISFDIKKGDFVCFMGASGSGKTTLIRILQGYLPPTSGFIELNLYNEKIKLNNHSDLNDQSILKLQQKTFFVPQNPIEILLLEETPKSIFQMCSNNLLTNYVKSNQDNKNGKLLNEEKTTFELLYLEYLKIFNLYKVKDVKIRNLSAGQKQKVAIGCALLHPSEIKIFDEPTSNLDSISSEKVLNFIKNIAKSQNLTCIFSTHSEIIAEKADYIFELYKGFIRKSGKYSDLIIKKTKESHIMESVLLLDRDGRISIPLEFLHHIGIDIKGNQIFKIKSNENRNGFELTPINQEKR
ncbi:MAG: ATP-binding cassette domain-containing protein [Promethearchaeota archaeon]